ncbi:unnamed protein product [Effrenium voratum]|nr:unnamed protein product [Effrenium voratum]
MGLTLECIPESYSPGSSVRLQEAVSLLVGRIITDPSSVSNLEEALAALSLAFDVIDCQLSCAKELVHAAEGDLRLMLLATKALRADRSLLQPLCRSLLAALSHAEDVADEAWAALSQLLRRLGPAAAAELLAETDAKANNWLRLLLEGSSSTELSPLLLLSRAKGPLRGAVQAAQLRHMAQHSAKLLEGASLETEASELLEVFWEVLLAVTVGAAKDEASLSAAARVWGFLRTSSKATRLSFLEVCAKQAAAEGQAGAWWLEESEPDAPIATASLGGLLLLRHVLPALWPDRQAAEELGAEVLLKWALEADDSSSSKGWGHAAAEVVRRAVQLGAAPGSWVSAARSELRGRLRVACAEKTVTEQLLALAGAVEAAPMRAKEAAKVAVSDGPLITAASEGDVAMAEPNEEELDMGLVDTIEKLLRWSQASSETSRADALAAFAAACWPSVSSPGVGGTLPSRMTRLALEMLGAAPGPAALAAPKKPLPAMPGTWRLVAALCRHGQWPESSWPGVLQSLVEANHWLASAQLSAFVEDAFCAAAELLPLGPVPLDHLASLLHCSDAGLRSAAARQLQRRSWVPQAEAEATPSPAQEALEKLAGLLEAESEEKEPSEGESGAGAASAGDVSFCVLKAVLGQEMTHTVWSAGEALSTLASWEEGDEPGGRGYGSRMREGHYCALAPEDAGSTPSCSSRGRNLVWMSQGDHERLPPECERQCVAAIASWETLLSGIDRGLQGDRGGKGEKEEASPASLLATLVQLSPDQLVHGTGKSDFPANVAPPSHWATPLQPLLRLLCHILTSSRLAGFTRDDTDASEALLAEALKEPVASYDLIPLAARTLLLALRLAPAAVRSFWEQLPRSRDQNLVEKLIARSFTPLLIQAEAALAISQLEAERDRLPDIETSVVRRPRQLLLQLSREDLRAELSVQLPPSFPLRPARAEFPEKMPGIPKPRVRNWILQAQKVLSGQRPLVVGRAVLMWSRSFALYFKGVEDCPICYNVIQLTTQTIPRKACPTCKHKFHDKCLYQWFRTSSKTTCPLCNQPF